MSLTELANYLLEAEKTMGEFQVKPYYCKETNSLICYLKDERSYDDYINKDVSVFRSIADESIVGFEIRGIEELVNL